MKKVLLSILFLACSQLVFGQEQFLFDTIQTVKETNIYEDTLWVMDSSYAFKSYYGEMKLKEKYKVLSRDELGNKLTAIGISKRNFWDPFENAYLDSITYFDGTEDVQYEKTYIWNNINEKWMDSQFHLFNENQRLIEYYHKTWIAHENQYMYGYKANYEFEFDLLRSILRHKFLSESEGWETTHKAVYLKYGSGVDSTVLFYVWDTLNEQWKNRYKNKLFYDDGLQLIDIYYYNWDSTSSVWLKNERKQNVYNDNDQKDSSIFFQWDSIHSNWIPERKYTYKYNETDQLIEFKKSSYDLISDTWYNTTKTAYNYYASKTIKTDLIWDTITEAWVNNRKEFKTFINSDLIDTLQSDHWDTLSQHWIGLHRSINTYDKRLNQTDSYQQRWDDTNLEWTTWSYEQFFWSLFNPLSIHENQFGHLKLYPNPASSKVYIMLSDKAQGSEIVLYNASGQAIKHIPAQATKRNYEINVTDLPPGLYVALLLDDEKVVGKQKVIINR